MSLSAKFAQLKKTVAPSNNNVSRPRVQNNVAAQQSKRAAQNQSRRTGAPVQNVKSNNNARGKSNKPARGGKVILNGVKKNLRKNGNDLLIVDMHRVAILLKAALNLL